MTRKVLKSNGQVVYRSTVRSLMPDKLTDETMKKKREEFTDKVNKALGADGFKYEDFATNPELVDLDTPTFPAYADDDDGEMPPIPDADDEPDADTYDQYVGAEVTLPLGDQLLSTKVRRRKRTIDGSPIGKANQNPILDTRAYNVEFADGQTAELLANVIAQNTYAKCDTEGNQYLLLNGIVDHRKDGSAVKRADMYVQRVSNRHIRKTTKGWQICVKWKDGTTTWERQADVKESNPVELADYAVAHGIENKPAFAWWVPFTLRRCDRIIVAINSRYHKRTQKIGIEIPKTYEDCIQIDRENGNTLWQDAIRKEMTKVRVAFQVLEGESEPPPTFQQIRCHLVYDVKMEDFQRKARLVAGGHMTTSLPAYVTYAGVVSRESVRIALTLAALNNLKVKTADIENSYLTASVGEKIWCRLGPEFGSDSGKKAVIVRAFYGLKSAGSVHGWGMSSGKYIQLAVWNVKELQDVNFPTQRWLKQTSGPFPLNYAPELDTSPLLDASMASFYHTQIGVLRWCVELGCIDITTEGLELSTYLAQPRDGHLDAVFHIFNYLEKRHNSRIVFDPTYPIIDMSSFKDCDWKQYYGNASEATPPNAPEARGKEVDIRLFVNSDHANDQRTRRSRRTGYIIYLNMAPIIWFSKKQSTIETSVFGAEFMAMKQGMEALCGLQYKLRMMGVPLSGPSYYIYGDNMSVIHNMQQPESTLKKKSNSVCYHAVRKAVAMGECLTGHVSTHDNPADICTKIMPGGQKRDHLIGLILYNLIDHM